MDFFDELSEVIARDGARRGVRATPEVWSDFTGRIVPVKNAAAPVGKSASMEITGAAGRADAVNTVSAAAAVATAPEIVPAAPSAPAVKELPGDWESLRAAALVCRNCHLCASRRNVVFGEGSCNARLMFIGEGPGADEDATGRPFVGAAGQLLDKMIAAMHLAREEVYIANIVKCRPPGNRMPGEDEAAACIGFLEKQIELVKPEVIVLLGGTALHFLLHIDGITRARGRWQEYKNIAVMPTFHPAFLLRKPDAKREAWHDLKLVMNKLGIPI